MTTTSPATTTHSFFSCFGREKKAVTMPRATSKDDSLKRKRKDPREDVKKRPRTDSSDSSSGDEEDSQAKILLLETEILESKKNYNNIVELIGIAKNLEDEGESAVLAAVALCRVFIRLLAAGSLTHKRSLSEKEGVVVQWLKDRLSEYKKILVSLLAEEELASTALTLAMKVLKAEGEQLNSNKEFYVFPKDFLEDIIRALFEARNYAAGKEFVEKYVDEYDDVRFFTHQAIKYVSHLADRSAHHPLTRSQEHTYVPIGDLRGSGELRSGV